MTSGWPEGMPIVRQPRGEQFYVNGRRIADAPDVRSSSTPKQVWHFGHFWILEGCLRYVTTIQVQGFERSIVVAGQHIDTP